MILFRSIYMSQIPLWTNPFCDSFYKINLILSGWEVKNRFGEKVAQKLEYFKICNLFQSWACIIKHCLMLKLRQILTVRNKNFTLHNRNQAWYVVYFNQQLGATYSKGKSKFAYTKIFWVKRWQKEEKAKKKKWGKI